MYKISSIRELIPRIFVEAALFRIFSFLLDDPYTETLQRLLQQTNGIGHPLISAYARSYIVKKGLETDRNLREYNDSGEELDYASRIIFSYIPHSLADGGGGDIGRSLAKNSGVGGRGRTLEEKEKEKVIFKNNFDDFLFQLQNAKSGKVGKYYLNAINY